MVSVAGALPRVNPLLQELFRAESVGRWAKAEGHRWRERILTPGVLLQLLVRMALFALVMDGLRVSGKAISAAAVCQARKRLPMAVLRRAMDGVLKSAGAGTSAGTSAGQSAGEVQGRWHGYRVVVADALSLRGSSALAGVYGRAGNGSGRRRGPAQIKLAAVMDLSSEMIEPLMLLPGSGTREASGEPLEKLLNTLGEGDLLLGDRGYGGYPAAAQARRRGAHLLLRLQENRVGERKHARVLSGSTNDRLVEWIRPSRRPKWMTAREWDSLPETMVLREVSYQLQRKGRRTVTVRLITSLTDPAIPREELARLYARRWAIETAFRQLKKLTGLGRLKATTRAGIEREVWCAALAYNLVRLAMVRLADKLAIEPSRLSMVQALRVMLFGADDHGIRINPNRPGRSAPRKLLDHRKRFAPLKPGDRKRARTPITLS